MFIRTQDMYGILHFIYIFFSHSELAWTRVSALRRLKKKKNTAIHKKMNIEFVYTVHVFIPNCAGGRQCASCLSFLAWLFVKFQLE